MTSFRWIACGFGFSIVANQTLVFYMTRRMWRYLKDHAPDKKVPHNPHSLTRGVGVIEAVLYTASFLTQAWAFIGVWLALKAAVRWRATSGSHDESGKGSDNLWLIGCGLSVVVAYLGACIASGHWLTLSTGK